MNVIKEKIEQANILKDLLKIVEVLNEKYLPTNVNEERHSATYDNIDAYSLRGLINGRVADYTRYLTVDIEPGSCNTRVNWLSPYYEIVKALNFDTNKIKDAINDNIVTVQDIENYATTLEEDEYIVIKAKTKEKAILFVSALSDTHIVWNGERDIKPIEYPYAFEYNDLETYYIDNRLCLFHDAGVYQSEKQFFSLTLNDINLNVNKNVEDDSVDNNNISTIINNKAKEKIKETFGVYFEDLSEYQIDVLVSLYRSGKQSIIDSAFKFISEDFDSLDNGDFEDLYEYDFLEDEYVKCYDCDKVVLKEDAHYVDGLGEYVCEDCIDNYNYCDRCESYTNEECHSVNTRYGEQYWCETCIDNHAFCCYGNDEYYDDDYYSSYTVNGEIYSQEYCDDHFYCCQECGEYFDYDDFDEDTNMCLDCAERNKSMWEKVQPYHHRPPMHFYGDIPKTVRSLYYHLGFELEVEGHKEEVLKEIVPLYDRTYHELYFNKDGSVPGFEIISQPHTFDDFKKKRYIWAKMCEILIKYGYKSHNSQYCGLHVHLSRQMFGKTKEEQDRNIAKIIAFIDAYWDDIVKISRRDVSAINRWAGRYDETTTPEMLKMKAIQKDYEEKAKKGYDYGRYMAVNTTNENTVEFRFMKGTLKVESFMSCVDFIYHLAINSKKIAMKNVGNVALWLKGISKETKDYIISRDAFMSVVGE